MPRNTFKKSRRQRRRTLRRVKKKGGGDSQSLAIPSSSFDSKIGSPANSDNMWHKIG